MARMAENNIKDAVKPIDCSELDFLLKITETEFPGLLSSIQADLDRHGGDIDKVLKEFDVSEDHDDSEDEGEEEEEEEEEVEEVEASIPDAKQVLKIPTFEDPTRTSRIYVTLPKGYFPETAFHRAEECDFIGFDSVGYAFVRFKNTFNEEGYHAIMEDLNMAYSAKISEIQEKDDVQIGEILVARVKTVTGKRQFIRCRIISFGRTTIGEVVHILDIDDQSLYQVLFSDLYPISDYFWGIPTMCTRFVLRGTEPFIGTKLLSEISLALPDLHFQTYGQLTRISNASTDGEIRVILYGSSDEADKQSYSLNDDIIETIAQWNETPLTLEPGTILNEVRITGTTPDGLIYVQFQSEVLSYLQNLQPNCDLRQVPLIEVVQNARTLRRADKAAYFFIRTDDNEYRRVYLMGVSDQPRDNMRDLIPHNSEWEQKQGEAREQYVMVDYIDYGIRETLPFSKLIPPMYFNEMATKLPPQGMEMMLQHESKLGEMLLSPRDIEMLQKADIAVEICQAEFVNLPIVNVLFLNEGKEVRSMTSASSCISVDTQSSASVRSGLRGDIPFVLNRLPISDEKKRPRGRNFRMNPLKIGEFKLKHSVLPHHIVLKEMEMCIDDES